MAKTISGVIMQSPWVFLGVLALLIGSLVLWNGTGAVVVTLGASALALGLSFRRQLPALALGFLGVCLLGYAFLGRGFAYVGVAPLYIGEMALALCLLALALRGGLRLLAASPLTYLLAAFMALGAAATLPYFGTYGLDTLRDAVIWGYALFALAVAALLLQGGWVLTVVRQYARFVPIFLVWSPLAVAVSVLYEKVLPKFPGANAPLIDLKGGDVAVLLAGVAALLLLGLPRAITPGLGGRRQEWLWWALWIAAAAIPVFRNRAGLLAIAVAVLIVVLLRPRARWWQPVVVLVFALTCLMASNARLPLGKGRTVISADALLLNVQSITESTGDSTRDNTRQWRLMWWNDIVNYTLHGPYFWTGKGYGINLADADGYQVDADGTLRSPHNGHLAILARSGVPGFAAWALLQAWFALSLLFAYRRATVAGHEVWAKLNVWTLAFWAAFMVNTSFDVYLEGPQGGIWFWSLFGFGIALLETQRRLYKSTGTTLLMADKF